MVGEQPFEVDAGAVFAALERHFAGFEDGTGSVAHRLLQALLELGFELFAGLDFGSDGDEIRKRCRQMAVVGEVNGASCVSRKQTAQCTISRIRAVSWRRRIRFDVLPEAGFEFDQLFDEFVVAVDAMNVELLTAYENGDVASLLTGDGKLVLELKLNVFGRTVTPELRSVDSGRFAFQNLHVGTGHLPVEIGEHEGHSRMPKYRVDLAHPVSGLLRVRRRDDRFEQRSPVDGMGGVLRVRFFEVGVTAGLFQPEFELALVRIEAQGSRRVRTADSGLANGEPVFAFDVACFDQPEGSASPGWAGRVCGNAHALLLK